MTLTILEWIWIVDNFSLRGKTFIRIQSSAWSRLMWSHLCKIKLIKLTEWEPKLIHFYIDTYPCYCIKIVKTLSNNINNQMTTLFMLTLSTLHCIKQRLDILLKSIFITKIWTLISWSAKRWQLYWLRLYK